MALCKQCNDEVEKLVSVKVAGKAKKMCEDCADRLREAGEIAEASESVVQAGAVPAEGVSSNVLRPPRAPVRLRPAEVVARAAKYSPLSPPVKATGAPSRG